jgi:hypothetical protein
MKQTAVDWLFEQLWDTPKDKLNWYAILYQAKEMEKGQMIRFAEYVATNPDKNKNVYGEMLHAKSKYDDSERTVDLLEQYYNETFGK